MLNDRKEKPLKRVTITVDPDDYAVIDSLARDNDVSASWLIRRSMREFLERHHDSDVADLPGSNRRANKNGKVKERRR